MTMDIFARAMLAAHKAHGDIRLGSQVHPIHEYTYTVRSPGFSISNKDSFWRYLCDFPIEGWLTQEQLVAARLQAINLRTLEVGSGSGRFLKFLTRTGVDNHGIDHSEDAIELMARRGISADLMDGHDLHFADREFPLVYLPIDTIEQSRDLPLLLSEACRVADSVLIMHSGI